RALIMDIWNFFFCCRSQDVEVHQVLAEEARKPVVVETTHESINSETNLEQEDFNEISDGDITNSPSTIHQEPSTVPPEHSNNSEDFSSNLSLYKEKDLNIEGNGEQDDLKEDLLRSKEDITTGGIQIEASIAPIETPYDAEGVEEGRLLTEEAKVDSGAMLEEAIIGFVGEITRFARENINSELEQQYEREMRENESIGKKANELLCKKDEQLVLSEPDDTLQNECLMNVDKMASVCDSCENSKDLYYNAYVDNVTLYNGFYLPPKLDNLPTLVLDLDNTLIYSSYSEDISSRFTSVNFTHENITFTVKIKERPFLPEFLLTLSKHYEIIVFSAGVSSYCRAVVEAIDKNGVITHVLDRRHCTPLDSDTSYPVYTKSLDMLGRDLSRTIIVDDIENSYIYNYINGQIIPSYGGGDLDDSLLQLKDYLLKCLELTDFRTRECLCYTKNEE
ncbi:CTD small phosphatase-like protein 2, partial [Pancytospora epiphaga]